MSSRLALAFLLFSATAALAQPAVPAVPPAPGTRPAAAAPVPAARPAPAPDADAPPTSGVASSQAAAPAQAADAPPTSDAAPAAAQTASAAMPAPDAAASPASAAEPAQPAVPPTVTKNYPLTPEGNARFLADYAARPDVKKLPNGVLYRVLHAAEAKAASPMVNNDTVTVTYRGWLIDGTIFDQTKPGIPIQFNLGALIPGWRAALLKMKVGDMWEIAIPAGQAYGEDGRPGRIPPNQALVFVVSLAKVEYAG